MSDILLAIDAAELSTLTLLDLLIAFDTSHYILLCRIETSFGLTGSVVQ